MSLTRCENRFDNSIDIRRGLVFFPWVYVLHQWSEVSLQPSMMNC